tara:strand:+ start:122 stop:277 length:156 start_codon:yes stop_codon:yes gene_type:complete
MSRFKGSHRAVVETILFVALVAAAGVAVYALFGDVTGGRDERPGVEAAESQ